MLQWDRIEVNVGEMLRAKVPGGWFICLTIGDDANPKHGAFYYPDAQHEWDGNTFEETIEYVWCPGCQQTFVFEVVYNNNKECPVCGMDLWSMRDWDDIRDLNPDYPEEPEMGKKYTQFKNTLE